MICVLWDTDTNNIIRTYENERKALALVQRAIDRNGSEYSNSIALASEDDDGNTTFIAMGQELAERARMALQRHLA